MYEKRLAVFETNGCVGIHLCSSLQDTKHFQWKTSLWFDQKETEQEKCLAGWSTPFHRVRPATQSRTLARAPYEFIDANLGF